MVFNYFKGLSKKKNMQLQSLEYLLSDPLQKIFTDSWSRGMLPENAKVCVFLINPTLNSVSGEDHLPGS